MCIRDRITGFGQKKIEKYGEEFLAIIQQYANEKGLTSTIKDKNRNKEGKIETGKETTQGITLKLFNEGLSINEIAQKRNFAISTVEGHLAQLVKTNEADVFSILSRVKVEAILQAIEAIKSDGATELLAYLGNDYSYTELRYGINYAKYLKSQTSISA